MAGLSAVERLAREILETRRLATGHATAPQLGFGSLDGGWIEMRDPDGGFVGGIGLGPDGGLVVDYADGPKPGTPTAPTVTADAGVFCVSWDGSFEAPDGDGDPPLPTSDLDRVEVHASMDENFVPDRVQSFAGAFSSLDGGSFTFGPLPEAGTYYFRLVARSKAQKYSVPSERVEQELAIASMDLAVTDAWLTGEAAQATADGKNSIFRGPGEPPVDPDAPFKDGDIWFEMTPDGKSIPNIWDETTGAWVGNDDYRQSEIERVQQELRDDLDAVIVDGSGTKNFYRGTMPTDAESSEGDLWFDSSDSNKPYIYQNGEWVTVQSTFASPGAGEILASRNSEGFFDKAATSSPDFAPAPEKESRFVYSGSATGTVSVIVPVLGAADPSDLSMAFDGTEASKAGLGLLANLALYANSPGGTPNFESVFLFDLPSTGQVVPTTSVLPVSAGSGGLADATHHVTEVDDNTATLLEIYLQRGLASRVAFGIRVTLPAAAGAWVEVMDLSVSQTLGEDGISDNAITTDKIAAGAITAESGIIGSINAGTITVGEMDGARIKAQSIAADRVLIGDGSELMPDEYGLSDTPWYANFDGGAGTGWSAEAAYPGQSRGVVLAHKPTGTSNMSLYANTLLPDHQIAVQPGETYQVFTWVYATGPVSGFSTGVAMQVYGYSNGAYKTNTRAGSALATFPSGEWVKVGGVWTAPAGIDKFSPRLTVYYPAGASTNSAKFYLGRVSVKRQVGATLIEGGAITTEHIRTGAITAESGIIGSIDANVITVGKIMGNQLDADAINGKTITGATIRTASSGSRVELTHNGLKQYNSLGATIVDMTSGSFTLQGGSITGSTIRTAASGSRVEMDSTGLRVFDQNDRTTFLADTASGSVAITGTLSVPADDITVSVTKWGGLSQTPGVFFSGPGGSFGLSRDTGMSATGNGVSVVGPADPNETYADSRIRLVPGESTFPTYLERQNNYASMGVYVRGRDTGTDGVGELFIGDWENNYVGRLTLGRDGVGGRLWSSAILRRTYSGQSDVCITSAGTLGRRTSARRYKTLERTISPDSYADALLGIEHKSWVDKEEFEASQRLAEYRKSAPMAPVTSEFVEACDEGELPRHVGAIADDFHEAGLGQFVIYDEFGRVDGLHYNLIGVALIPIVKQLRDRVEELEALVAA